VLSSQIGKGAGPVEGSPLSLNRYAYADDNPIANTDPTGAESCGVWACETYDSGYTSDDPSSARGYHKTPSNIINFADKYLAQATTVAKEYNLTPEEVLGFIGYGSLK
jgi:hypothetical protein